MNETAPSWRQSFAVYFHPTIAAMLFLGFSSGLPFPLVLTTLSARLRQSGIDRTTIGYFSLVGLAYSLKFFWSPAVDRLPLPFLSRLGRRRSWILLAQILVIYGLVLMAFTEPADDPTHFAMLAALTAFAAATQDIGVDAWRIESVDASFQGAMAATYQVGYQLALITAGAGALFAASVDGWSNAYLIMTCGIGVGIVTTLLIAEPQVSIDRATHHQEARVTAFLARAQHWPSGLRTAVAWLIGAVVCPFVDFISRFGAVSTMLLSLIVCYRLNYTTMGVAANTFYLDMGFNLDQIALVSKSYGAAMTIFGAVLAGFLIKRFGFPKTLLVGCVMLSMANLFYACMSQVHADLWWFGAAVSIDNVANGIAGTAFVAFMSSLTNVAYTATQYALFGTLWSFPAKLIASQWGRIVDAWGYGWFFVYTALMGLPALVLVAWLMRRYGAESPAASARAAAHE